MWPTSMKSHLFAMCEKKLESEVTVASVMELLVLADLHNASRLKRACFNVVQHNSAEVHQTSQWKQLKQNCEGHASLLMELMELFVPK